MTPNKELTEAVCTAKACINELCKTKDTIIIAVDGPCGSGKTTFTDELSKEFSCNVIRADDFFLMPFQRTEERLNTPGGNLDRERLLKEVLIPLKNAESFTYRPYDCKKQELSEPVEISVKKINIVEGSYSCHPELWDFYDLHIFAETDKLTQLERLKNRSPKTFNTFLNRWIPLEEKYFNHFDIKNKCELVIKL